MEGKGNLLWWAESSLSCIYSFTFQIDLITEGLTERGWNVYVGDPDYRSDGYRWKLPYRQIISLPREIDSYLFLHLLADLDIKAYSPCGRLSENFSAFF